MNMYTFSYLSISRLTLLKIKNKKRLSIDYQRRISLEHRDITWTMIHVEYEENESEWITRVIWKSTSAQCE